MAQLCFVHDVDSAVHGQDDGQRDVEGTERREEGVERFLRDETDGVVLQDRGQEVKDSLVSFVKPKHRLET